MPRPWPRVVIFSALLLMPTAGIDLAHGGQSAETPVDCSEGGRSQLEMNVCAGRDADAAQARLETLLVDLEGTLEPPTLAELRDIQTEWEQLRERECQREGRLFSGDVPLTVENDVATTVDIVPTRPSR